MVAPTVIQAVHRGGFSIPEQRDSSRCPYSVTDVECLLSVSRRIEWHDVAAIPRAETFARMLYGVPHELSQPLLDRFVLLRRYSHLVKDNAFYEFGGLVGYQFHFPVKVTMTPGAFVVYMHGCDYGNFVYDLGVRTSNDPVSIGLRLTIPNLPSELRGAIVIVNLGDGDYGTRSPEDVAQTRDHELSHVQYALGFQRNEFVSSNDLAALCQSLSYPYALDAHAQLAGRLRRGMDAWAHSELIAYGSNRVYSPLRCSLGGNLWQGHHAAVTRYLHSWYPGDAAATAAIKRLYRDAEVAHTADVDRYAAYSGNIFRTFAPLRAEAVLLCTNFGV